MGDALAGLQEIPLPDPISYVPQTAGWLVVAALLFFAIVLVAWRIVRHRRRNAYRREALAELVHIEQALAADCAALPSLLKRTAIAATSRAEAAALSGDEWLRFLDLSLGGNDFAVGPGQLLPRLAYSTSLPTDISSEELQSLIALSRRWIKHHHAYV